MCNVGRLSLRFLAATTFISGLAHALPVAEYPLGKTAAVTSLAGRSDTDLYIMRDQAIFHFDGKRAAKTKNQPVCVATYPVDPSNYPFNVDKRDAEIAARRFRARPSNAPEDGRWQPTEFTTLMNESGVIRLYGSGDQIDVRGSVRRVFTARLRGNTWLCEGWFGADGGVILELAHDGERTFVSAESFSTPHLYQDPETYPFAPLPSSVTGVTASGIHGVWAWSRENPTTYHLDGFGWDTRPLADWASVARVQSAGLGRAFAIGSTTQQSDDNATEIKSDALALWNGSAWVAIALPEGFTVQRRGLLVSSTERVLLVGENGQYYWYQKGAFKPDYGPRIRITAVWQSPSGHWFVCGQCGDHDCLLRIGGQP
jgi:hypothetical protein